MKLFTKYNRINLLSTVVIFLLASIAFSFLIRYIVISRIDDDLKIERNEILSYAGKYGVLPSIIEVHDQYTTYQLVNRLPAQKSKIVTKKMYDPSDKETELERVIIFGATVNRKQYLVTVSKSLEDTDDLIQSIILITVVTIVLILTTSFFINRLVLQKLWQPFYTTLQNIETFQLANTESIILADSHIDEFKLLNATLAQTISKAKQDYLALKEFTENAAHEMQTPLAVIRSKLDLLIQNEDLTEQQSQTLQGAFEAITSFKKLNQSLLLLAKIENRQFAEKTTLDMADLIRQKQSQFCEQWNAKHIVVETKTTTCYINANAQLIDILLNNLLSNATKHNYANGFIRIGLQSSQLRITNSGKATELNERIIFNRFYKGDAVAGSHGLGLSIVKQICDVSGYAYHYHFDLPDTHSFIIGWH